jgi:PHD/YefM family antitoxin component YafN of YafNO toxin-antitoxin module
MVAYSTDELVSSSKLAKQFGAYLRQIKNSSVEKLAILKNNSVEAVLISKDDYEKMYEALKKQEAQEIIDSINRGLEDVKNGKVYDIDTLWDRLDED